MNSTKRKLILSYGAQGFTLIELLIVIVIIAILAGLVIGVLNPVQQQNRARDGTLRSTLSKMALSTKSLLTSSPRTTNVAPTEGEFIAGIANATSSNCTAAQTTAEDNCTFQITGITLPSACANNGYVQTTGSNPCEFVYVRSGESSPGAGDADDFRVAGLSNATPRRLFVYAYEQTATATGIAVNEGFYSCPNNMAITFTAQADIATMISNGCTPL